MVAVEDSQPWATEHGHSQASEGSHAVCVYACECWRDVQNTIFEMYGRSYTKGDCNVVAVEIFLACCTLSAIARLRWSSPFGGWHVMGRNCVLGPHVTPQFFTSMNWSEPALNVVVCPPGQFVGSLAGCLCRWGLDGRRFDFLWNRKCFPLGPRWTQVAAGRLN